MIREDLRGRFRESTFKICDLVEGNYYRAREPDVRQWIQICRARARAQPDFPSRTEAIERINRILGALGVSHLALYTPDENRKIWENEAVDTGLRARWVEDLIVISEVIQGSPADKAGVKTGDVAVSIDGLEIGAPEQVETESGLYSLLRVDKRFEVKVSAETLSLDLRPRKAVLSKHNLIIRIQSFLAQYFEQTDWIEFAQDFSSFEHIIIDLRGNAGGSFPATLRALSVFHCQPTEIGFVYGNESGAGEGLRETHESEQFLEDNLEVDSQLKQLASRSRLYLRTFSGYPCYSGKVTVLTDSGTNSMAEIFAESFLLRPHSRVWGQPTAGQVVMAQWFPVTGFGVGDFSVSIPVAGYLSQSGEEIEGVGLTPQRLLGYDKERMLNGIDSWLADALATSFQR